MFHGLSTKGDLGKNREKSSIKQRINEDMQNRAKEDVLEVYKDTDRITRHLMWIRFPTFRKAFDEIDDSTGNNWQVSKVVPRNEWYKKESG